jgi:diguanylate cyclase (GGDEF)-like protein
MSEPTRTETQHGIAELKRRLSVVGLQVTGQHEQFRRDSFYFAFGNAANQTDIVLSREFLDDLPNTKDYQAIVDAYACAVAGRLKCGSPEIFYCQTGVAIQVSIQWPIQSGIYDGNLWVAVLMYVTSKVDGKIAKCSMQVGGGSVFDYVIQTVNSVRSAVDSGQITFHEPDVHQEVFQRIERKQQPQERRTQPEVELFIAGKVYVLGFIAADEPSEVWTADPWDALYLGVPQKELSLAMRVLRAKGLLHSGSGPDYVQPTDKLLAERSAATKSSDTLFQPQQRLSRSNLPSKEELLKDMHTVLSQHELSALLVIDLDNFKAVNDKKGHSEGDACLDKVITTIGAVVGRRGKIYRWGGDEFTVCLPDFSTIEALTTAERIRSAVEQAKPGGEIEVTASIGVCGSDCAESKSPEELLDFADKAMYKSKYAGKNRVTAWPLS